MRRSVITGGSTERHGGGNVAAKCIPEILMRVAVKSGFALHNVMEAEFVGADEGSWWVWAAWEARSVATPLQVFGR